MATVDLADVVAGEPSLKGLVVFAMPECLLVAAWARDGEGWRAEEVAAYLGDLVRANRAGLKALGAWSAMMQVTIESAHVQVLVRELGGDLAAAFVFGREAPLGMVRVSLREMTERLHRALPPSTAPERPRGARLVEFLRRYAPDPHASLARVALQTGIPLADLQEAGGLDAQEVAAVERSICEILGIDRLRL